MFFLQPPCGCGFRRCVFRVIVCSCVVVWELLVSVLSFCFVCWKGWIVCLYALCVFIVYLVCVLSVCLRALCVGGLFCNHIGVLCVVTSLFVCVVCLCVFVFWLSSVVCVCFLVTTLLWCVSM